MGRRCGEGALGESKIKAAKAIAPCRPRAGASPSSLTIVLA
jgi:hypothetical protein